MFLICSYFCFCCIPFLLMGNFLWFNFCMLYLLRVILSFFTFYRLYLPQQLFDISHSMVILSWLSSLKPPNLLASADGRAREACETQAQTTALFRLAQRTMDISYELLNFICTFA